MYDCVHGQTAMQMPQNEPEKPVLLCAISRAAHRHANASKKSLRCFSRVQLSPVGARPGQASTHARQSLQRDSLMGVLVGRGASVSTRFNRMAEPNCLLTRRAHLPIQPNPARVPTVLCGSSVEYVSGSTPSSVAAELIASNPRPLIRFAVVKLSSPRSVLTLSYSA